MESIMPNGDSPVLPRLKRCRASEDLQEFEEVFGPASPGDVEGGESEHESEKDSMAPSEGVFEDCPSETSRPSGFVPGNLNDRFSHVEDAD